MALLTQIAIEGNDDFLAATPWSAALRFNDRLLLIASPCCRDAFVAAPAGVVCSTCGKQSSLPPALAAQVFRVEEEQWALETLIGAGADPLTAVLLATEARDEISSLRRVKYE